MPACRSCGEPFRRRKGPGRPAVYCGDCRDTSSAPAPPPEHEHRWLTVGVEDRGGVAFRVDSCIVPACGARRARRPELAAAASSTGRRQ